MLERVTPLLLSLLLAASNAACGSTRPPAPVNLPAPVTNTTVGPDDVFEVHVYNEPSWPKEYKVQPDGSINFPFLDRVDVNGKEPQDIVEILKERLAEKKILTQPQVSVVMKAYNSKRITLMGQVARPGTVPWANGLKLVEAIAQSGGFTNVADSNHVILTRQIAPTKTFTAIISIDAITDGQQSDVFLQAGDTIKVEPKSF